MKTTTDFFNMKKNGDKITMVTAYDAPSAKLAEDVGIDTILVGDSLGMVVLGYDSTVPVTIEDMIHHTKAVKRGAQNTFIVTDMPFLTYHASLEETFSHAKRLIQDGNASAVKMEGGGAVLDKAEALVSAGVPVVAHLGLTPQSVGVLGGYRVQGKSNSEADKLMKEAKRAEVAGVCMLVLECVPEELAKVISTSISIPVIGIGAGRETDGQVLVFHDVIGYTQGHVPKFVKKYSDVSSIVYDSLHAFHHEVKDGVFPEESHVFKQPEQLNNKMYGGK
ncbi:3-methyl-2-oxobutanoate hydroxymethyltransferase [Evansella cellulosilytica]|uniref:3-methyl-2-oxobutanoate hydroxymethyltransferase n=1 Tax=Evansella cellulosilytica (strain ATCC 21833 / DSM 2522 / FERM P-1141 / JCM 9156 / N-4) TaxID=649639 RepID=E6TZJ1_EVAC2|nr:3-methyl-2-oxobutanoate hydroxymethyltransferase [Evansella cellulosilytica]ADU30165.1 3-methyl-2-oxobutanoate hydroxymethyltransferase [Evansella cellulosilytica DSM 2522]